MHTIAGEGLDRECASLPPLGLGQAQITGGYNLPCKYVIHTSGPAWCGGLYGESDVLRSCYIESLKLAVKHKCKTVAFPLISSGVYCCPKDQVLKFAIQTITEFFFENELTVYICVFDKESYTFSRKLFNDIKEFIDDEYTETHDDDFYLDSEEREEESLSFSYSTECQVDESPIEFEEIPEFEEFEKNESAIPPISAAFASCEKSTSPRGKTLEEYLKEKDAGFREMLFEFIDRSGMTDVECYKKANVDKRTFSKIKSNKDYRPSKPTAIAFAISLKLSMEETQSLLATLGFTLSRSATFDKIICYFIHNENYDIFEINEALFEFDQQLLGSF